MYILYTTTIKGFRFISAEILGSVKNQGKLRLFNEVPIKLKHFEVILNAINSFYRERLSVVWKIKEKLGYWQWAGAETEIIPGCITNGPDKSLFKNQSLKSPKLLIGYYSQKKNGATPVLTSYTGMIPKRGFPSLWPCYPYPQKKGLM